MKKISKKRFFYGEKHRNQYDFKARLGFLNRLNESKCVLHPTAKQEWDDCWDYGQFGEDPIWIHNKSIGGFGTFFSKNTSIRIKSDNIFIDKKAINIFEWFFQKDKKILLEKFDNFWRISLKKGFSVDKNTGIRRVSGAGQWASFGNFSSYRC